MIKLAKIALLALLCATTAAGFLWLRPVAGPFRDTELARIVVFHVPRSIVASVASVVATWYALKYLWRRRESDDIRSRVSFSLALLFWILTTATGAIFARAQWGQYWSWDIKQTSILALLMIDVAYFALRAVIDNPSKQAAAAAAYSIFAVITVPFLTYIFPNSTPNTLHPKNTQYDMQYWTVLWTGAFGLTMVYFWVLQVHVAVEDLALRLRQLKPGKTEERRVLVTEVSRL